MTQRESTVPNFRMASGLNKVYRSAAPDGLVEYLNCPVADLHEPERIILNDVTLIIDLRSADERLAASSLANSRQIYGELFERVSDLEEMLAKSSFRRQILIPEACVPTKETFINYACKHWILPDELESVTGEKRVELIFQTINKRGLMGFVESFLEAEDFTCTILKAMTMHLEGVPDGKVLIHCSLGKDRTGILAMLCQSILGLSDETIVEDFARSSCIRELAERRFIEIFKGRAEPGGFAHASPEIMITTLQYIRTKYGSVESYLDAIGFDTAWRNRFISVES